MSRSSLWILIKEKANKISTKLSANILNITKKFSFKSYQKKTNRRKGIFASCFSSLLNFYT